MTNERDRRVKSQTDSQKLKKEPRNVLHDYARHTDRPALFT